MSNRLSAGRKIRGLFGLLGDDGRLKERLDNLAQQRGAEPWVARFEHDRLSKPDGDLALEIIETDPRNPTVVFMPGTNAYALLYGEYLGGLADAGFNIVAFDPRGHGRSDGPRGSYVLEELLTDLDAVVTYARDRFKGEIAVSGSSQGGITCFYYAATHPDLLGAVLHNAADLAHPRSNAINRLGGLTPWVRPLVQGLGRLVPELPIPMEMYINLSGEPVRGVGSAHKVLWGDPMVAPFVRARTLSSLSAAPMPVPVEEIQAPILMIQGGRDTLFPDSYMSWLFGRLTCSKKFLRYPDQAHYVIVDHGPKVAADVAAWLESRNAQQAA